MTNTTPNAQPKGPSALIGQVLARRNDPASAAWTASVRRGLTPSTEIGALGATERHLAGLPARACTGARRAAAICAGARGVPQRSGSVGASLHRLDRAVGGSRVETRVGALPLLDVENAAQALSHLVDLCAVHGIAFDFYDLANKLTYWGDGITTASQETRRRVVADYYGVLSEDDADQPSATQDNNRSEGPNR